MITCLCPGDDRAPDLDAALEVPFTVLDDRGLCLAEGPHFHRCYRPAGHGGRHADSEDLPRYDPARWLRIVTAVWDD